MDKRRRHDIPAHGWSKNKKFFNGKPIEHWQKQADKLVIECLVRASNVDTRSIVGEMAHERLLALALAISPELLQEVLGDRARCQAGLALAMDAMLGNPSTKRALDAVNIR
jgi:hypothetical protein